MADPRGHDIAVGIDLPASPERVWAILEPIEDHVRWMADAESIRFEGPDTRGVGTRFVCDTKFGPIRLTDRMEITVWDPPHTMGVRHTGVVTGSGRFELEPIDAGARTRFTWSEQLRLPWYLGGRLGEVLGGRFVIRRVWRRNLRRLHDIVEATTT